MAETVAFPLIASTFRKREVNDGHHSIDRTHLKDLKNLVEVRPPDGNFRFIFLRAETARDHIPFTPLDQLPLNLCHCPAICVSGRFGMRIASSTYSVN
jgi:hypothetical protein